MEVFTDNIQILETGCGVENKHFIVGTNANPLYRALAALELSQVLPRPGGIGVRKCRRPHGFSGYFADRETALSAR
jgi:hypothetical protein